MPRFETTYIARQLVTWKKKLRVLISSIETIFAFRRGTINNLDVGYVGLIDECFKKKTIVVSNTVFCRLSVENKFLGSLVFFEGVSSYVSFHFGL